MHTLVLMPFLPVVLLWNIENRNHWAKPFQPNCWLTVKLQIVWFFVIPLHLLHLVKMPSSYAVVSWFQQKDSQDLKVKFSVVAVLNWPNRDILFGRKRRKDVWFWSLFYNQECYLKPHSCMVVLITPAPPGPDRWADCWDYSVPFNFTERFSLPQTAIGSKWNK